MDQHRLGVRTRGLATHGSAAVGEAHDAGFLIEKSLSVDNVFVWARIFSYFTVPREYQHRVLFWGIFGALVLRGIFIFAGVALIERFSWIIFVFGAFLLFTARRWLLTTRPRSIQNEIPVLKLVQKVVPSTHEYHGQKMFVRIDASRLATTCSQSSSSIETTDVRLCR